MFYLFTLYIMVGIKQKLNLRLKQFRKVEEERRKKNVFMWAWWIWITVDEGVWKALWISEDEYYWYVLWSASSNWSIDLLRDIVEEEVRVYGEMINIKIHEKLL